MTLKQNFYDDGQLFEDMFNRSHFVTESDKTNLVFVCLVSMINNNIHWVNVQELQTFFFIQQFRISVSGLETKNLVSSRSQIWQRLNNQTLGKDRPKYVDSIKLFRLNRCYFRSLKEVLPNWFFFPFSLSYMEVSSGNFRHSKFYIHDFFLHVKSNLLQINTRV